MARRSSEWQPLALLHKVFSCETEKWDFRKSAKTEANSLGEKQLGKLRNEVNEEGEPTTERGREHTDLGLDLCEREKQVACHISALAITNKACREVEMYSKRDNLHYFCERQQTSYVFR